MRTTIIGFRWVAVWLLLAALPSCDPTNTDVTDPPEYVWVENKAGVIGTKGGEIYINNEVSPINKSVVSFKPGVLNGPHVFTLTQAPANITIPLKPNARIIHIEPDTIPIMGRVSVGMSYSHLDVDRTEWIQIYHFNPLTRVLTKLEEPDKDANRQIMYGKSSKLGYFTILQESAPAVETGNFTDTRDNQIYKWLKVNDQVWMAENLNFSTGSGSWAYNDVANNANTYGRLYDWYAAASACPPGWHLPSHDEWIILEKYLGEPGLDLTEESWKTEGFVGSKLKSTTGWNNNGNGIDAVKFAALPGGFRDGDGTYAYLGEGARFWTRTSQGEGFWARYLEDGQSGIYWAIRGGSRAMSVRCVQGQLASLAVVQTVSIENITTHSALANGNVLTNGGSTVTEKGVCWNTTGFPQVNESHAAAPAGGTGSFSLTMSGLQANTTYFVRAYATNNQGTAYGSERSFTTEDQVPIETGTYTDLRNQRTYKTVKLGGVWWMAENLNYPTNQGSWCYGNAPDNCDDYGRLYEWVAAKSACPPGWYLATDADWIAMETYLGMDAADAATENWRHTGTVGSKLKSAAGWMQGGNGTNESQFSVFPGGFRDGDGSFQYLGYEARFWTGTLSNYGEPWARYLEYNDDGVYRSTRGVTRGMSVRCVQGTLNEVPSVTTTPITNIESTTATGGGNVTAAGNSSVTARGICWNTTGNPIANENATTNGSGLGSFTSQLTQLSPNTTYYVRAYALNEYGYAYGEVVSFTTKQGLTIETSTFTDPRDFKVYNTVKIGNQWWFAQNLNFQTPADSWCFNDNTTYCQQYGRLYSFSTANLACPAGWRLPTDAEWRELESSLGMSATDATGTGWRNSGDVGYRMKSTSGWPAAGNGINDSKFAVLPGGFRDGDGTFYYAGTEARFWSATRDITQDPWVRYLEATNKGVYRETRGETRGFSVRCIKN